MATVHILKSGVNARRLLVNGRGALTTALITVWLVAAVAKALSFAAVVRTVERAAMVPAGWETVVSALVIFAEVLIAFGMLLPRTRVGASYASAGLSSVYVGYAVWRVYMNIPVACECFGALFKTGPVAELCVSGLLCVVSLLVIESCKPLEDVV